VKNSRIANPARKRLLAGFRDKYNPPGDNQIAFLILETAAYRTFINGSGLSRKERGLAPLVEAKRARRIFNHSRKVRAESRR
jgi:hypothetical protein